MFCKIFYIASFIVLPSVSAFNWSTRVDNYGNSAGILATTPFPITESSSSYSISNDEGTTTFTLGTLYFVDGAMSDDTGDGTSRVTAKKTIGAAITAAGNGNKTILVRGAHDAFSGIYTISGIICGYGTDNTHRWMLVGYGQERPILDADSSANDIFRTTGQQNAYATIQRVKLQNCANQGIRLGNGTPSKDNYFNVIDVWGYGLSNDYTSPDDGSFYASACNNLWIYHCRSERSYGHTYKIGDGSSYAIIEWSIGLEAGYWTGMAPTAYYGNHPENIEIACDSGVYATNNIVRYNIFQTSLFNAMELRNQKGYSVHHNEFVDNVHFYDVSGCETHGQGVGDPSNAQILVKNPESCGSFYANVVHDPGKLESGYRATGIAYTAITTSTANLFYNNLVYGHDHYSVYQKYGMTGELAVLNNTITSTNSGVLLTLNESASTRTVKNNILATYGSGSCVSYASGGVNTYNIYYYPNGSRGYSGSLESGGVEADPHLLSIPGASFVFGMGAISISSPAKATGTDLSSLFTSSFNSSIRSAWDIGAYGYYPSTPPQRLGRWKGVTP